MTDAELKALLRPHVAEVVRRARMGRTRAEDDPRSWGFRPAHLAFFSEYFASDDGTYPGDIHTAFQVPPATFAHVTGLRRIGGEWHGTPRPAPTLGDGGVATYSEGEDQGLRVRLIFEATARGDKTLTDRLTRMSARQVNECYGSWLRPCACRK